MLGPIRMQADPSSDAVQGISGRSYYRARYYDATDGRFLSEDPIAFTGGTNFYRYSSNNPINLIDPFGLNPVPAIPWPWPWFPPGSVAGGLGRAIGAVGRAVAIPIAVIYELTVGAKPLGIDDASAIPKPEPCPERRKACGDQWAKDIEFCAEAYPDDPDMQQACYEIADLNLERCLNGQTRVDPRPTPKKKP
jgi:RHS repeat-associated protein